MDASTDRLWRVFRAAAWDGLLPVVVLAIPVGLKLLRPGQALLELSVIFVPMFAAMIRAAIAYDQVTRICGGRPGVLRQVGVAAAIVLLLLFESAAGVLTAADDEPPRAWLIPVGLYAAYLVTIAAALKPVRGASPLPAE